MSVGPRAKQLVWFAAGAGLLALAGVLQRPLAVQSEKYELAPPGNIEARQHPEITLLTMVPGGLRAPLINILWIRSQQYHQEGRHFDAMQLASLICRLQPRFPGVWIFHSWNMAWNISSTTRTPEERWHWVYNGIRLLRDEGISMNPTSVALYRELAYIFFEKMGGNLDEMHREYKQIWAGKMQRLLGAPPYGTTEEVIEAFRPVAEAPLDKSPSRQGRKDPNGQAIMQADQLRLITDAAADDEEKAKYHDPKAAEYSRLLAEQGVKIDHGLLEAYNTYSLDEAVQSVRPVLSKVEPKTGPDKALFALINNPAYASARGRLLAFVRAQIVWHEYKMDPSWMLRLMEDYEVPLDWRQPVAHGFYWITYGIDATGHKETGEIESMNVDRQVLNCLKHLTWYGRLTYEEDPSRPDYPRLSWSADGRYIAPTHDTYDARIKELVIARNKKKKPGEEPETYKDNKLRDGHINYLTSAIEMLVRLRRMAQAQEYLDWINEVYQPAGSEWHLPLEDFVFYQITEDGAPIPQRAANQLTATLQMAMYFLVIGDQGGYRDSIDYAKRVYEAFQASVPERIKLPPLAAYAAGELTRLLLRPRAVGFDISFDARIRLYSLIGRHWPSESADTPGPQLVAYDTVAGRLRRECKARNIDFDHSFPPPRYLQEYRRQRTVRLKPSKQR